METKKRVYDTSPYEEWADAIVDAVADYWLLHGYGPSVHDICVETGMSTHSRMQRYIRRLQEQGRLAMASSVPRSLRLTRAEEVRRAG